MSDECNHILGFVEGTDESWLVYSDDSEDKKETMDVFPCKHFKLCPECGERLDGEQ